MGPFNFKVSLGYETKLVYGIGWDIVCTHDKCDQAGQTLYLKDKDDLLNTFQSLEVFSTDTSPDLQNIATQKVITKNTEDDLLMAC